ncbi:undecaprenyl-diphosphate phosphatase [Spongiibacter sp. KMU-166]|uniref:Undecaprenyl-diphosphatase n=1 Tax=Spongiibacter thalassae TaxID=2721624 RepID=A0ABX1GEI9_9GAMM|nr:undecaprenyl-diphosphate phosphatase [Spongiibacter thalassae]NKI16897.1 undecaprenyl-diphosphate phosphatase [Spongiibacter thalassae]
MDILQAVILAAIQGLTEFLPVSSSGHLVLPQALLGWEDQGLAFDVAVHVGSLMAVLWYFRRDVENLVTAWSMSVFRGQKTADSRIAWMVIVATIPAIVAGLLFNDFIELHLRNGMVLATTTLVFGVILGIADRVSNPHRRIEDIGLRIALLVGLAQALALVPGTSRSGITITVALLLGLGRSDAARFSFYLSMPIIAAAGGYKLLELLQGGSTGEWLPLGIGILVSAVTAYACIHWFMGWVERIGMLPFAIYRVVLALIIYAVVLS